MFRGQRVRRTGHRQALRQTTLTQISSTLLQGNGWVVTGTAIATIRTDTTKSSGSTLKRGDHAFNPHEVSRGCFHSRTLNRGTVQRIRRKIRRPLAHFDRELRSDQRRILSWRPTQGARLSGSGRYRDKDGHRPFGRSGDGGAVGGIGRDEVRPHCADDVSRAGAGRRPEVSRRWSTTLRINPCTSTARAAGIAPAS